MPAIFVIGEKMEKIDLRKKQIESLKEFADENQKKIEDKKLLDKFMSTNLWKNSQSIGITSSLPIEVDTSELIARLWDEGKDVYLARANNDPDHTQDFLEYTYMTKLKKSKFGVDEVANPDAKINNELDLIVVPGLAFALDSHARLGFGGGYYDRFLKKYPTKTIALANSRMVFEHAQWPVENFDVPIQTIITPTKIYK